MKHLVVEKRVQSGYTSKKVDGKIIPDEYELTEPAYYVSFPARPNFEVGKEFYDSVEVGKAYQLTAAEAGL